MQRLILFLLLSSMAFVSYAQTATARSEKLYKRSVELYKRGELMGALKQLDLVFEDSPRYAEAWLLRADILNDQGAFPAALESYAKAVEIDSTLFPPALYIMGNLCFELEQYTKARSYYQRYLQFKPRIQAELKRMDENIPLCFFRDSMMQHAVDFVPVNIGPNVNSSGFEYVNAISLDESTLFFTRKGADIRSDESFYRSASAKNATGELNWGPAVEIGEPINTPGNEGAMSVSPDGMTIAITCCSRPDSYGSCDIYLAKRRGETWTEPVNLGPEVNTAAWESQPAFAADGRTLYFVSARSGGFGGSDIYKTVMQPDGYWSKPMNLGPKINTPADEMAPFIHPDGRTLYFSSRGHKGMGGADLFVSRLGANNQWQTPVNLGYPVNTKSDEINLVLNSKGDQAYLSAERAQGKGNMDIYRFLMPMDLRPAGASYVKGRVFDEKSKQPLSASFQLIDLKTDSLVVSSNSDASDGEFLLALPVDKEYALNVSCPGYLFHSENFNLSGGHDQTHPRELLVPMQRIEVGQKVVLKNIFFGTDEYNLLDDSKAELGKLIQFLQKNPAMCIEIGGHTDDQGSAEHNLTLSQNRAMTVFQYLKDHGIAAQRLSYKGYGEDLPIDSNLTPEGRANNRRTEFKVVQK